MNSRVAIISLALLVFLCILIIAFSAVPSKSANDNVSVSALVPATIRLSMDPDVVDFGGVGLEPGDTYNDDTVASISSNKSWALSVRKDRDLTGQAQGQQISSGNFKFTAVALTHGVTWVQTTPTEFGTSPTPVAQGTRRGGIQVKVNYSLFVPWDVEPDTYTATHTYTAIQP